MPLVWHFNAFTYLFTSYFNILGFLLDFMRGIRISIALILLSGSLTAQNHLYNTDHFGINSSMLGGVVTAGDDDVSMTYYNPAAIHMVAPQVNISLLQPVIRQFGFEKFWGSGEISQVNTDLGLEPTVISFKIKVKNVDLAFLKISKSELTDFFNAKLESAQGNLLTTQFFEYEYSGQDRWFGMGSSFKLATNLYIGLSSFLSLAHFSYNNKVLLETRETGTSNPPDRFFDSTLESNYRNIGFISKAGLLYDSERHDIGFTITTPKYLRLRKSGNIFRSIVNIDENQNTSDQIIDTELSPTIKTPWEFNLGYSLALRTCKKIWINASYHASIPEYTMANILTAGNNTAWNNGSQRVLNFGIAYSQEVNTFLELSAGFRTNNFAYENRVSSDGVLRNVILDGNHIHFVVGSQIKFKRNTILIGVDWGSIRDVPDEENFELLSNIGVLAPELEDLSKSNLSILFTYGFILDGLKKLNGN